MKTSYLQVDASKPEPEVIAAAANLLRIGELVAFPTETVYGLGADAFQPEAVEKIFLAKGRPAENPLLVHISQLKQLEHLAKAIPAGAQKLMQRFWPGPISLILPAVAQVPAIVRGGREGVGVRMPDHPVARALIDAAGPLAAPSANLYGRPSPTCAQHVRQDLDGRIAMVLDAGATGSGLESTLVDFSVKPARVLRWGGVRPDELETCLGEKLIGPAVDADKSYHTRVKVVLSMDLEDFVNIQNALINSGQPWGRVDLESAGMPEEQGSGVTFRLKYSLRGDNLYAIIREAEEKSLETLLFAPLDVRAVGQALIDRLRRAAQQKRV